MPTYDTQRKAAELQRELVKLTGHELATVRPYGKHLFIQMNRGDTADTVARLTAIGRNSYESASAVTQDLGSPCQALGTLRSHNIGRCPACPVLRTK